MVSSSIYTPLGLFNFFASSWYFWKTTHSRFADDCVCLYREIRTVEDTLKLQKKLSTPLHMNFLKANCLVMVLVERHWNGKIYAFFVLQAAKGSS